ncbi:MAG: beta-ketoacyl-ACP synthase III [Pseudomonadota bacterium]
MDQLDAVITGVGAYLPERILTNHDVERLADTSDEWIRQRSGVTQRHFAADGQATSDLMVEAAKNALNSAALEPNDIGLIIVGTVTPDKVFPSTAVYVQEKLNIPPCTAFDVVAACAGFVYGLDLAAKFVRSGEVNHALVIGGERLSGLIDWEERSTCALFGDGAGACILSGQKANGEKNGVIASKLSADGRLADILYSTGGPGTTGELGSPVMNGKEVFKNAVANMCDAATQVLAEADTELDDVDWFIPHQANIRIIDACAHKLNLDREKVIVTIDQHANTSAASIPLALDAAIKDGRIQRGQLLLLTALGAGLAWGGALVRY